MSRIDLVNVCAGCILCFYRMVKAKRSQAKKGDLIKTGEAVHIKEKLFVFVLTEQPFDHLLAGIGTEPGKMAYFREKGTAWMGASFH